MLNINETNFLEKYPFLKVLDRPLDQRQLKVCCTDGDEADTDNIVVAAGAGSGKTQVLAARFAFLVVTGAAACDQILTLTFTKKAAAEMYQRIYATLQKIAASPDACLTAEQSERVERALQDFSNAHIQTLDSYCSYLVKQAANRYGIRPDFTSGGSDSGLKAKALEYVLKNQKSRGIAALAKAGKIQEVAEEVFAPVISRFTSVISPADFFSSKLEEQCRIVCEGWNEEKKAFDSISEKCDSVRMELDGILASKDVTDGAKKISETLDVFMEAGISISSLSIADLLNHNKDAEIKDTFSALQELLSKIKILSYRATAGKAMKNSEVVMEFFNFIRAWKEEFVFSSLYSFISHVEDVKDLLSHFDAFLAQCNSFKKQTGQLTFADVSELALDILKKHDDIRKNEHETYRRIMIDEFQDNNRKNGELLELIHRPTFFVGDDKQSIYKFRGAEVDVFNEKQNEMKDGRGTVLPMDYNYRSNREILDSFNLIFGGYKVKNPEAFKNPSASKEEKFEKLPDSGDGIDPWVFDEAFTAGENGTFTDTYKALFTAGSTAEKNPLITVRAEDTFAHNNPLGSAVPVHAVMYNEKSLDDTVKPDYISPHRRLALYIARTILSIREKDPGFSWSDVAILEKSRTNRSCLTDVFSRFGIPYAEDQQMDLFSEAIVNDFYHFLRLCVYSFDVNAFAAFLRSPFASLSEQALESVLFAAIKQKSVKDQETTAFRAFDPEDEKTIVASLSKEDGEKYLKAERLYTEFQPFVLRSKLSDTINRLWYSLGYWYNASWHKDTAVFASQYDLLFALACKTDEEGHTAAWFVDQLSVLKKASRISKEDDELDVSEISFPMEESDAVKIMTIHKSKGLQFKYVFVLGCASKPKPESNKEQYYFNEESGLSVKFNDDKSNYFFTKQKEIADAKNDAEFRRLFYVALTRAEQQAWMLGYWSRPKSKDSSESPMLGNIIEYYYTPEEKTLEDIQKEDKEQETAPYNAERCAPFDFTELYPVAQETYYASKKEVPVKEKLRQKIAVLGRALENTPVISMPALVPNRTSPSRLESADCEEKCAQSPALYPEVNAVIEKTFNRDLDAYEFGYNDFGTLAHLFMEMNAKGVETDAWEPDAAATKKLYGENRTVVLEACRSMVRTFNESEQGKAFAAVRSRGDFWRSEYAFRMKLAGFFVTGSIDLLYKSADGYVIVDYKTDQELNPERYYEQLYCYRRAAACLCHVDENAVSCRLFYLRSGKEVDITKEVAAITEEQIAEKIRAGIPFRYDEETQTSVL